MYPSTLWKTVLKYPKYAKYAEYVKYAENVKYVEYAEYTQIKFDTRSFVTVVLLQHRQKGTVIQSSFHTQNEKT